MDRVDEERARRSNTPAAPSVSAARRSRSRSRHTATNRSRTRNRSPSPILRSKQHVMDRDNEERARRLSTPAAPSVSAARRSRSRSRHTATSRSRTRHRSRSPVRVETTRRSRSRTRRGMDDVRILDRNRSRSPVRYRSRSPSKFTRSPSIRDRERELERERYRIGILEDELYKRRRQEDLRRSKAETARGISSPRDEKQRSNYFSSNKRRFEETVNKETVGPVFTAKDVADIINSVKNVSHFSSQPSSEPSHNSSINHKNILPDFDPSAKNQRIDIWLKKVNECATVYGWDEKTTIHFAMQKLQGLAKTWYESLNTILFSWPEWQEKLINAFPCDQNYGQSLEDMLKRKSRYNEPIEVYYYEKLALLNRCDIDGKRAVDCIIHGLTDKTVKSSALALRCTHPDQLLQFLMSNKECSSHTFERTGFRGRTTMEFKSYNNNSDNKMHSKPNTATSYNLGLFCYNCKERGHPYMKCPKPLVRCTVCHKLGHSKESCRFKGTEANQTSKNEPLQKTMCISVSGSNSKFHKDVSVNGLPTKAFVDFGSSVSLIAKSNLSALGLTCENTSVPLKGFGNEIVNTLGRTSTCLIIDGVQAKVNFEVVDDKFLDVPVLIGQSFTEQPHVGVYKNSKELIFFDLEIEMPFANYDIDDVQAVKVTVASDVSLDGPASIKVVTEPKIDGNILVNGKVIGKPTKQYTLCGGVYKVYKGITKITITPNTTQLNLIRGTTICRAYPVQVVNRIETAEKQDFLEGTPGIGSKDILNLDSIHIGECADDEDTQRLFGILEKYKHCFAFKLKELGCTNVTEMSIEVNSKQPIVYRPYRLSHKEREQVREMIAEMLDAGIIRESVSEYASPILLVRKKDGKWRLCIDYRMLNAITVKEHYPMPIIEDEIARLSGQAYFITLDLASGYYQVPISESSKALTAFVTPDGQYEFNRMPFGLANAPAVFQRMMNKVLGSARYTDATAYIDDVLIYGKDKNECLTRLEKVLGLLEKANLTLNLSKCEFLKDKIDYLGYEISGAGIRPGDKKIQCVLEFPTPTNQHTLRQFLGLVGYFRKFIKNFAHLSSPLSMLLKKDAEWCWTEEQQHAFKILKERLVNRPILAIYDPSADSELHTDASKYGIGGILLQRTNSDDTFRPVAYYSRQTTPEEKHFHAYELETLAVVCCLKKFRVYLLGQHFKIVTDCSALRSTFLKRDIIPRIARWWLLLQEFQCSIEYRPGIKMAHVDALSRNPIEQNEDLEPSEQYPSVMIINTTDWLQTLQLGDTELGRLKDIITSDIDAKGLQYIKDNYVIKDNGLYKCIDGNKDKLRWVVPKGARWQICRLNHDDIGHFGVEKTIERIKQAYWFPKMSKFIKKYVQACVECAYSKKTSQEKEGYLHIIEKVEVPFHTIHIDHLGPFVRSKRGNTHLLVAVDAFTKFIFLKPVRNTNTQNVIRALEDVFYTFRFPDRIISDRGSCFTSHAFKKFCQEKGIKHVLNAVASPRSNGQVERYNRTILDSLTAQNLNHDEKDWDGKVGTIQWGLNNTKQKTTGRAPAEVMFGTSIGAELNPKLNEIRREACESSDVTSIREEVKNKIREEQVKQKEHYDKGRKPARIYNEGELVKIRKVAFNNAGKSTKLLPSYVGPYRVVAALGNDRYRLAAISGLTGSKNKRKTTVAADRMLPWVHVAALDVQNSDTENEDDDKSSSENE